MAIAKSNRRVDATEGPMFFKMFFFVVPLMLTNLLNHLYNMADNIVVGQFSDDPTALAAVGVTASLNSLFVNLAIGISVGSGVLVARNFGARDKDGLSRSVHTAMTLSVIVGIILGIARFFLSEWALVLMGTKAELMPNAVLYCQILALGMPGTIVFTFGSSVLRSVGDSKTPLYASMITGILNVLLNLFFVIVCGMSVAGVALATIIAKYVSAAMVMWVLIKRRDEDYAFDFKKMCLDGKMVKDILYIGIPSSIQSAIYSFTNVFLTAAFNTFSIAAMSARTIATNIDTLIGAAVNTYQHASVTFTSQNYGAKNPERMKKSVLIAVLQAGGLGIILGQLMLIFNEPIVNMYLSSDDPSRAEVMMYAKEIMTIMLSCYFIGFISDTIAGFLRGLGASINSMLVSVIGVCGIRIAWIFFVFPTYNTVTGLYMMYPVSWSATALGLTIMAIVVFRKVKRKMLPEIQSENKDATVKTV